MHLMNKQQEQTLALASILQCAQLVQQLSTTGKINQPAYEASLESLFKFDSPTTLDVFGDLSALITGFKTLLSFSKNAADNPDQVVLYYALSMQKLAAKIAKNKILLEAIQNGLVKIQQHRNDYDFSVSSISNKVDLLYQETVSKISPRIMIQGNEQFLSANENTSKIRTLLFCGIRAAFLWHQLGGSKWKLIFSKKQYLKQAEEFYRSI